MNMKRKNLIKIYVLGFVSTILLLFGLMAIMLEILASGLCGADKTGSFPSSDNQEFVETWIRNCGATTSFTTLVTLSDKPRESVEIDDTCILLIKGDVSIRCQWQSNQAVQIIFSAKHEDIYFLNSSLGNVKVEFMNDHWREPASLPHFLSDQ
jgi:hypothetical protein